MSNRPMFDDDNLPAWLTNAGITGGGGGNAEMQSSPGWSSAAQAPAQPASTSSDLSWMDSAWEGDGKSAEPAPEGDSGSLPWFSGDTEQQSAFFEPASTGDTPWMSDIEPTASSASAGGFSPLESTSGKVFDSDASSGAAESMPWMSDVAPSQPAQDAPDSSNPWDLGAFGDEQSESQPAASTPPAAESHSGTTGMLPWRQGASDSTDQPQAAPSGDSDASDLSWMNEAEPAKQSSAAETEGSGLDWMSHSASSSPYDQADSGTSTSEPEAAASSEAHSDWAQGFDFQDSAPSQPEATSAPEPATETDWTADLQSNLDAPKEEPAQPSPAEPAKPTGMIKHLGAQPPSAAPPTIKKLGATPPPAEVPASPPAASQPSIKKLPTQPLPAGDAPAQPASQPTIKKLTATPSASAAAQPPQGPIKKLPTKPQPELSNMTYEEWERSQIAKEEEAKADPGDKLLEEIPDWFAGGAPNAPQAPAADPNTPAGADLMPEWFLGMEEKSDTSVPAWFSGMDLSSTSLVGPETVQTPSTTPPAEVPTQAMPSADDVPDWFKGESPVAGIDFESMFVTSSEPEPSTPASKPKIASLLPREPEPAALVPAVPEAEAKDLDWMGEAVDSDDTLPPGSVPATPSAPADDADWMNDMPDFGEVATEIPPLARPKPDSQPAMSAPPAEAATELPVADDLLSDLDWLNEPVSRTPTESSEATPANQTIEAAPAEASSDVDDVLGSLDWMGETPAHEETPAATPEDDVPEWMREMAPSELQAPASPPPEESPAKLDANDDWLSGVDFSQPAESAPAAMDMSPGASAAPKPYTDMPPELAEKLENLDLEQKVGSSDIDSLLHLTSAESLAITRADQPPSAVLAPQDINLDFESNTLDAILGAPEEPVMEELTSGAGPSADNPLGSESDATSSPTGEQPRPKRLTRLTTASPEDAAPVQALPSGGPQEDLPEWVENLKPTEGPVVLHVGDQQVRMQEQPLGKVPAGVRRIREQSKAFRQRTAETAAPESGPLSGIESAIPIVSGAVKPGALTTGTTSALNELHTRRVKIIQGILEQEDRLLKERKLSEDEREEGAAAKAATRPGLRIKVDRLLITLVLALAVIAPFFTGALNLTSVPDMSKLTAAQNSVAKQIDALQPDNPVLVAFEFGPTGAGELDILARAAILDILKHRAHPIIVSTNPAGVMHAQALLAVMSTDPAALKIIGRDTAHPLVARQDYVILRYLPGGATGVRSLVNAILGQGLQSQVALSTDSGGQLVDPAALKLANLRASPAFILAESPEDVRNWVEQYRPGTGEKPLGLVMLTSVAASATAQAYSSGAANIFGPLVGLRDAISYQQVRGLTEFSAKAEAQRWQSVGLAGLLAVIVVLFSSAINLIRSLRKRDTR